MGRLSDLQNSPKAKDLGYQDSRRNYYHRLWEDPQPKPTTIAADWMDVAMELERQNASLRREVRLQGELLESVRTQISSLLKKRTRRGGEGTY